MEVQLIDEESSFWENHFPNLVRERQAGIFTHVLSIVFVRGAFLYGVAEAATHGQSIIRNNDEDSPICRAFYKIKEVTARAGIVYDKKWTAVGHECGATCLHIDALPQRMTGVSQILTTSAMALLSPVTTFDADYRHTLVREISTPLSI